MAGMKTCIESVKFSLLTPRRASTPVLALFVSGVLSESICKGPYSMLPWQNLRPVCVVDDESASG